MPCGRQNVYWQYKSLKVVSWIQTVPTQRHYYIAISDKYAPTSWAVVAGRYPGKGSALAPYSAFLYIVSPKYTNRLVAKLTCPAEMPSSTRKIILKKQNMLAIWYSESAGVDFICFMHLWKRSQALSENIDCQYMNDWFQDKIGLWHQTEMSKWQWHKLRHIQSSKQWANFLSKNWKVVAFLEWFRF